MQVIPDLKSRTIIGIAGRQLKPSVELISDDSTSYVKFGRHACCHKTATSGKEAVKVSRRGCHIAIGNVKRMLSDVHHKIKGQHLQLYLNESCYKFNNITSEKDYSTGRRVVLAAITYATDFRARTYRRILCGIIIIFQRIYET